MKISEQIKQWIDGRLLRGVQLAAVGWLAMTAITAAARYWITSGQAVKAIAAYQAMEKQSIENAPKDDDRIAKLLANNLFVPKAESDKPPQCLAILGHMALFGEEWKKVGQTANGAKILEIGPHFVKIQWNDKEHLLSPFDVDVKYTAPSPTERPAEASGGNAPPVQASAPAPPPTNESQRRSGFDRDQIRRRFESMTPEQRQEMFQRYQNASPEERQRMRDEFRRNRGD